MSSSRLTPQQRKAARLYARIGKIPAVAEMLGVDRNTVWRWSRLPQFQTVVTELLRQADQGVVRDLVEGATEGISTLRAIASGKVTVLLDEKPTEILVSIAEARQASNNLVTAYVRIRSSLPKTTPAAADADADADASDQKRDEYDDFIDLLKEVQTLASESRDTVLAELDALEDDHPDADWVTKTRQPSESA